MTREEIERLAELLRSGSWRNVEALSAADALISLLANRDRLETAHAQMQRSLDEAYAERDRLEQLRAGYENQIASLDKHSVRLEREKDDLRGEYEASVAGYESACDILTKERDAALSSVAKLEREKDDADNALARISQSLGGPDEWADQRSMIADAERRVASALVRIAELEEGMDTLSDENSDLKNAPWPEWAKRMKDTIREETGYDGYDDTSNGVD